MSKSRIVFSEAEKEIIRQAVGDVWQEIGCDCLQAIAEAEHKNVETITMSRKHVIEVCLDASRPEEHLRRSKSPLVTIDFMQRYAALDYQALIRIVTPAFPYTRYGM